MEIPKIFEAGVFVGFLGNVLKFPYPEQNVIICLTG
jgi:hypothetical protein